MFLQTSSQRVPFSDLHAQGLVSRTKAGHRSIHAINRLSLWHQRCEGERILGATAVASPREHSTLLAAVSFTTFTPSRSRSVQEARVGVKDETKEDSEIWFT